ncbi:MAG TPA: TlpA disulfide reductase family protein [Candidatus Acidoferrales bacterium]|nr:TlpA disulfide reductase family protein [Candidatus Acidoferrales bacterium]
MSRRAARRAARPIITPKLLASLSGLIVLAGIVIAFAVAHAVIKPAASEAPMFSTITAGDPAPAFSVDTTQGPFELSKAQRPVLLEIFATWCPHCQHETAVLNRLYLRYGHSVDFVAVTGSAYGSDRSSPETLADVLGFVRFFHVQYPVAFDADLATAKEYLLGGYPTIALIDRGKVAYISSGEIPQATLSAKIEKTLTTAKGS